MKYGKSLGTLHIYTNFGMGKENVLDQFFDWSLATLPLIPNSLIEIIIKHYLPELKIAQGYGD